MSLYPRGFQHFLHASFQIVEQIAQSLDLVWVCHYGILERLEAGQVIGATVDHDLCEIIHRVVLSRLLDNNDAPVLCGRV